MGGSVRYLAIGDIHGCFRALRTLLDVVPIRSDDVLITLGDYVDRGPESAAVLNAVIAIGKRNRLIALRGNHEIMMLEARNGDEAFRRWMEDGGAATLASYSPFGDPGRLADVPDEHWAFLETQLRPWFETPTHFFVHANAYADAALDDQPDYMLYWEQIGKSAPHQSGKIMICGHTSQKSGEPLDLGHAVCIDTWACGDGWLTCLDVEARRYWQANQRGQTRVRWLGQRA